MKLNDDSPPSVPVTLVAVTTGDPQAGLWLVGFFQSRLRALVNRLQGPDVVTGADEERAMRIVGDSFLAIVAIPGATPGRIMTEAARILREALQDRWARRARVWGQPSAEPAEATVDRSGSSDTLARQYRAFLSGIDGLPPAQREVFELVWFLGADPRLVGWLIGQSPRVVKRLWREARAAVRDFVAAELAARRDRDLDTTVEAV
jgi:DNA-directed RNA polymerase specialized sigma24 family protein